MSPSRTVRVPWFGSQRVSGQRDKPQPEPKLQQTASQGHKRGKKGGGKGGKGRSGLKVKISILRRNIISKKWTAKDKTPGRWTPERKTRTQVSEGGAETDADADGGDFASCKAATEKEKAKLAVLRTISRMLEENRLIRQRLFALTQAH